MDCKLDELSISDMNVVSKLERMRREIEDLRRLEEEVKVKNKLIADLERKVKQQAHEKTQLRNRLHSTRGGGVGGIDTSSSLVDPAQTSATKKEDKSGLTLSRPYAKPFQQLVSHIKKKTHRVIHLDGFTTTEGKKPQPGIINEVEIQALNGHLT